jgi:hypothetical protein
VVSLLLLALVLWGTPSKYIPKPIAFLLSFVACRVSALFDLIVSLCCQLSNFYGMAGRVHILDALCHQLSREMGAFSLHVQHSLCRGVIGLQTESDSK